MSEAPERIRVWPDVNDHFNPARPDWTGGHWDNTDDPLGTEYVRADLSQAAVEELEAKLAKAVEALEFYATKDVNYHGIGTVSWLGHDDAGQKARDAVAELTGGKDDNS